VIALDTNILIRALIEEEQPNAHTVKQQKSARALLSSQEVLFVPITAVLELASVLESVYEVAREEVADVLSDLTEVENLLVDRATAVDLAVQWYRRGLDFADALHLALSGLCRELATFDDRFAKRATRLGLRPPISAPAIISAPASRR
jgi:predicted nucleic-acid-binding protein